VITSWGIGIVLVEEQKVLHILAEKSEGLRFFG